MKKAEPGDWKTKPMPPRREPFPLEMEDKWFRYFADGVFYIFRSWTGFCIYEIPVSPEGKIRGGTVNRDPE